MARMRQKRIKSLGWALAFAVWSVLGLGACQKPTTKVEEPPLAVKVARVTQIDMPEYLRFTGDIEGDALVQVYATVPDRIKSMQVDVGDEIKKGQVLAVIEHTKLAQIVAQAEAQLAATRAQLAGAQVSLAGAQVGQASAWREFQRLKLLYKSGAVGQQQLEQAQTQNESAVTQVQAAQAQIRALNAQIQALRASLNQAQISRRDATIRSPIDGIVARRYRQMGDMASMQMPLVSIAQMDEVKVMIQVTERDLMKLRIAGEAEVRVAAYPERVFLARVHKIAPTLDVDTRTAPIELRIKNITPAEPARECAKETDCAIQKGHICHNKRCMERHPLKPGMIARVGILVKIHRDTLAIPLQALLNSSFGYEAAIQQQDLAVLILNEKNEPIRTAIRIGLEGDKNQVQVLSGLRVGQRLIVAGHNFYKDGSKIKIEEETGGTDEKKPSKPPSPTASQPPSRL